jgi:3-oxoacyl-[acyl-carrier-protein] synthase-3
MQAVLSAIEYYLPTKVVSTSDLAAEFPGWSVEKIDAKTGIQQRHIAAADECSSDLALNAARKLFDSGACQPDSIDFLLLCTQSPDYFLPTTACVLQHRLGIPTTAGALDFNLGCSGFVYGLGLAQGLISSGQASNILLITAETYSKFIHPQDKSVRTIFGDGAAATLVKAVDAESPLIGPFIYGTDGRGGPNLIVPAGGMRNPRTERTGTPVADGSGNVRSADNLYMNGAEIFTFTLSAVPQSVERLLKKADLAFEDVDLFIFHQANQYMLEHLRKRMEIPPDKFVVTMEHCGNTVSSTIPIALRHAMCEGRITNRSTVMLVGFGVGYSWGAALMRWPDR